MKYVIGLDVGIGSVGWAVVRNEEGNERIEDFGVRIFDSGEIKKNGRNERKSQKRRAYRSTRRLVRRRSHRKLRLKNYLEKINLITVSDIEEYFKDNSHNVIDLRVKALDEKITPQELAACLIHIANHRGYLPFYEISEDDKKSDDGINNSRMLQTSSVIKEGNYRTIAEAIQRDSKYAEVVDGKETGHKIYHNNKKKDRNDILFSTSDYVNEVSLILNEQKKYYSQLTDESIEQITDIIFSRRDFEDGPGDVNDPHRPYTGFYDSFGNCPYYKDEKRGNRFTLIGDLFALANKLSQYKYISLETGEVCLLPKDLMAELVNKTLINGKITKNDIKSISKKHGFTILNSENSKENDIANCFKYIKVVKEIFEEFGYDWESLVTTDYLDENNLLNRIGVIISKNITPKRRISELHKVSEIKDNKELIEKLSKQNFSGTASVSNKYMIDAVNAFLSGMLCGKFQDKVIKETLDYRIDNDKKHTKLPPFDKDCELYNNPVVFRSVNETRKIVNAIINRYGVPNALNVEVAKDLNVSFKSRNKITKGQNDNEKYNKSVIESISELLNIDETEITPSMVERYKLGEMQNWLCLYSNAEIEDKKEAILNTNKVYEVDHIVPFSLILDDTLNNKALVLAEENQKKGNRVPLMYMDSDKAKHFTGTVNKLYKEKLSNGKTKISKTKYAYLMLKDLYSGEAKEILEDWKSRNLNDTRYISKFLVKYFKDNLKFQREKGDEKRPAVYAVKGAITSRLRKQWLNKETWGVPEKHCLKDITYFDHAVDAIVVANCLPAYVEIAAENSKLRDIYYSNHKRITEEYENSLKNAVDNLFKFYGMPPYKSEKLLRYTTSTPSLIERLRLEVECRVRDYELMKFFINDCEGKTNEELDEIYRSDLLKFYSNDKAFAESIQMPIVSIKPERKYNGQMLNTEKDRRTFIKKKYADNYDTYVKIISDNNIAVFKDNQYYCLEIYKNNKGETCLTGIKRTEIIKKHKKLWLKPDYSYPEDYSEHVMYLFYGDYIRLSKRNETKEGYYFSSKNINQNSIYFSKENSRYYIKDGKKIGCTTTIAKKDIVEKIHIDILGKDCGVIKECGEPLSLLQEKN